MTQELDRFRLATAGRFSSGTFLAETEFGPFQRDWAGRDLGRPLAVARPNTVAEVASLVRIAQEIHIPVVASGGRTGLVRGTHARDSLVISLDRLRQVRDVADDLTSATIEAGVTVAELRRIADDRDARFPLSFGAEGSAQIGGALSTNAGGSSALRFGSARQLCLGLEVVLPDGRVLDALSPVLKDNTGLDLKQLFIGAEGTLGIITAATMRLVPKDGDVACAMAAVANLTEAMALLSRLRRVAISGLDAAEFMSRSFIERVATNVRLPVAAPGDLVLIEIAYPDGDRGHAREFLEQTLAAALEAGEVSDATIATSEAQRRDFWAIRERAAEVAFATTPVVSTDICLPSTKLPAFAAQADMTLREHDPEASAMTVGHLGDGNLHLTIWPGTPDEDTHRCLKSAIEGLAVALGGSFSAEHGIGLDKLDAMHSLKDPVALDVMRRIKSALDPDNRMNPGRVYPEAGGSGPSHARKAD